ncbi:hypothetical protein M422DRAFT_198423 [Sphaerobolus stellatus SS14]|nr:hypothetical protein M422DRAFT_198423 [Sphaerobolus stellatus SS14]
MRICGLKLSLRLSRANQLESPQGSSTPTNMNALYLQQSPAQSTTSLSEEDEEELDKSLFYPEPASPTKWANDSARRSLHEGPHSTAVALNDFPALRLPPEVLIHIFKQLSNPQDLLPCLLVSRNWCACSVELLWHKPHFPKPNSLFQMVSILSKKPQDQTFTYPRFVRRLNFLSLGQDLSSQLFVRLAACTRLERLTLMNCGAITDEALVSVLPAWPNLVALDLTNVVETTDRAIITLANTAKRLQGLNLGSCKLVTSEGIIAIAKNAPYLRRIKLGGLDLITDEAVSALALNCPLLLEVDLNNCEAITDASVRDLWTHSVHMREFKLANCRNLTDNAFPAPPRPPPTGPDPFPNSVQIPTPEWPPLELPKPFEHLRILDLTSCSNITDIAIEGIIANSRKIRNLVLAKCSRLTDAALESICKLGKNLHYLHLGHASSITDRSVTKLARSCLRLRYIDLACCPLLTDLSVLELASLPKLRRIGLVRVVNLTDQSIMNLGEQRRNTLERIHLSYCDQITIPAIHFLLQKLTKLTHLSLTGVPAFRHAELQQFCRPPPREFNATQRQAFCVYSNNGVKELRKYLTSMLNPIVDDESVEEFDEDEELDNTVDASGVYVEDSEREESPVPNGMTLINGLLGHVTTRRGRHYHNHATPRQAEIILTAPPRQGDSIQASSTAGAGESTVLPVNPFEWNGNGTGSNLTETPRRSGRPTRSYQPQLVPQHTAQSRSDLNSLAFPGPTGSMSTTTSTSPTTSRSPVPPRRPPYSSTPSAVGSTRSSQSNGVGFLNSNDPMAMQRQDTERLRRGTGTPELVFAEIGHAAGPGTTVMGRLESTLPVNEDAQALGYDLVNGSGSGSGSGRSGSPLDENWVIQERPDTPVASTTNVHAAMGQQQQASRSAVSLHGRRTGFRRVTEGYHHSSSASASPSPAPNQRDRIASASNDRSRDRELEESLRGLNLNEGASAHPHQWEGGAEDGRGRRTRFSSLRAALSNVGLMGRNGHGTTNGSAASNGVGSSSQTGRNQR